MFKNQKLAIRLGSGFAAMTVLIVILGIAGQRGMSVLSVLTTKLYDHPYTVSNAILEAKADIIAIDRAMKAIANSKTPQAIKQISTSIKPLEAEIIKSFKTIEERFLGDLAPVIKAKKSFLAWAPERQKVLDITLKQASAKGIKKTLMKVKVLRLRVAANKIVNNINKEMNNLVTLSTKNAIEFLKNSNEKQEQMTKFFFAVVIGAVLFSLLVSFLVTRSVAQPLAQLKGTMGNLAEGNLDVDVPFTNLKNEMGEMANAVQIFKENGVKMEQISEERRNERALQEQSRKDAIAKIADSFETGLGTIIAEVAHAASNLKASSKTMSSTATNTNERSLAVASAAEEASTNVRTSATAADELSSSIIEIGRQVTESTEISSGAVGDAERVNNLVKGLADSAQSIGEVVALISDIAEQTNLLALNATIEAARAGDAGKGFAIVASEVKSLANQTASATEEIASRITDIQNVTGESADAIDGIQSVISEMNKIATEIASAVEQQGMATQEIAANVQQVAIGTEDVSRNISEVTKAAGETGEAAVDISEAALGLSQQSTALRSEVDNFLVEIRQ